MLSLLVGSIVLDTTSWHCVMNCLRNFSQVTNACNKVEQRIMEKQEGTCLKTWNC
uniref:Uncharacterized protein n=1 Tax=Rhizophora mucronata TaxID=61149 RepID=A0A2P2Q5B3_RHIMU